MMESGLIDVCRFAGQGTSRVLFFCRPCCFIVICRKVELFVWLMDSLPIADLAVVITAGDREREREREFDRGFSFSFGPQEGRA